MRIAIAICALCACWGCHSNKPRPSFAASIADAHGQFEWNRQRVLEGNIHVEFVGRPSLDAKFVYEIHTGRTRMRLGDNWPILVWDGSRTWISPAPARVEDAAVTLKLWTHLIIAPLKLTQPRVKVGEANLRMLGGQQALMATVNFPEESGLACEAVVFADPRTKLLRGMTLAHRPVGGAEDRMAVTYYDYEQVEGVSLATTWRFWNWSEREGIHGPPIGIGRVYNLEFTSSRNDAFSRPADAREATPIKP